MDIVSARTGTALSRIRAGHMHPEARTEPVRQAAGAVHAVTHPGSAADGAVCSHSALRSAPAKPGFACWVGCNVLGRGESIHSSFLAAAPCPAYPRERSGRRLRCLMHLPLRWEADRPRARARLRAFAKAGVMAVTYRSSVTSIRARRSRIYAGRRSMHRSSCG